MRSHFFQNLFLNLMLVVFVSNVQTVFAEDIRWIEVIGEASISNVTREEAKQEALHDARAKAVRRVAEERMQSEIAGIQATVDSLQATGAYREYFDLFLNFVRSISYGKIIEEEILDERIKRSVRPVSEMYQATLKAKVVLEQGKQSQDFNINVKLNEGLFTTGDRWVLHIQTTKDCYITIFNIQLDGSMSILFPNQVLTNNFLPAGESYQFPPEGMIYRIPALPDDQSTTQMSLVIATRNPINFAAGQHIDSDTSAPMLSATLLDLHQWLVDIPVHQRTVSGATFDIVAKPTPTPEPTPTPIIEPTPTPVFHDKGWINTIPAFKNFSKSVKGVLSSKSVAIVIGVDEYQNYGELKYAVKDAQAVRDILLEKTNYEIYDELYNEEATRDNILDVVGNLINSRNIERIIFFFSGHGDTKRAGITEEDLGFFITVDADPQNLLKTAIPMSEIYLWSKSLRAKHVLFIFDACFSGIIGGGTLKQERDYNLDFLAEHPGRHVLTAGTKDDLAREYDPLGHGALTYFLLEGLRGSADVSAPQQIITLNELESYLQDKVTNMTKESQRPRLRQIFEAGDGELFIEIKK